MGGSRQVIVLTPGWVKRLKKILKSSLGGAHESDASRLLDEASEAPFVDVPLLLTITEASALKDLLQSSDLEVLKKRQRQDAALRGIRKLEKTLAFRTKRRS